MTGKTDAERKRMERERKAEAGLQRYEVWLRPGEWPMVKGYADRIARDRHLYDERGNLIRRKRATTSGTGSKK